MKNPASVISAVVLFSCAAFFHTGSMGDGDLHFYARAISKNGKIYLATATAKETQWSKLSDTLRQHVDSLKAK